MAPKLQFIGGLVSLLLFLYGWLASWQTMLLSLLSFRFDPQVLVPLVVCVGGLVVTNVRGWKKFKSSGKDTEAFFSAVDMDVPYMVWKHGKAFCQGKPCQDLQDVRQRQAEWRALPLSIATFCLIIPSFVEMPMCFRALSQIYFCEGSLAGREHLKELRGQFDAMSQSSTRRATLLWMAGVREASNISFAASGKLYTKFDSCAHTSYDDENCNHIAGICELNWGWWNSCHCDESLWYFGQAQGNMTDEWYLRKLAEKRGDALPLVVDPKVGSGHFLGFSALLWEFLQTVLPAEKLEARMPRYLSWVSYAPNAFFYLYMEQWRPWQWMLAKGLTILLVASLPISKKIIQKIAPTKPKLVQTYLATDLLIQVLTFTLAMALIPAIMITEEYKYESCYSAQHYSVPCPWKIVLAHHGEDLEPWMKAATMTSPLGYMPPFLVLVVLFLASYCSCMACGMSNKITFGSVASITFCSPLHLMVHEKISAAAKRLGTELAMQMVVRTLALASTASVSWALVGWLGMRVYLAVIFNTKLSPGYVILPILAMYTAHGALGVCTVRAVIQDLMSRHPPLLAQYGSTAPSLPSKSQPQAQAESSTNPPLPPPPGLGLASQGQPPAQPSSAISNAEGLC